MDKLKMHSPNLAEGNIAKLAELFPNCVTESQDEQGNLKRSIDFDLLRQELSESIVEGPQERYHLNWPGKREALLTANAPIAKTLRPCREESVDFDTTRNLFIEGDNLDALKLLQETYLGKVKMIYIDPPYNTGNDFIYEDDFSESSDAFLKKSNQADEVGNRLVANTDSNGRFHSDWLSMILPRLRLARNLLCYEGVIFVSIDEGEAFNLRKLCDEVFGEKNFVGNFIWQSRTSISNDQEISLNHNHTLVFARDRERLFFQGVSLNHDDYSNPDDDPRGPWKLIPIDANKPGGDTYYPIRNPTTGKEYYPPNGRSWAINPASYQALYDDGRIMFGTKGDSAPKRKLYLWERMEKGDTKTPSSLLLDAGTTKDGTAELMELFDGKKVFDYPKPTSLIERFLSFSCNKLSKEIVVDFFAGSGSTAAALMNYNSKNGTSHSFVLIQLPENIEEAVTTAKGHTLKTLENAIDFLGDQGKSFSLTEITKERIRRSGIKIFEECATTAPNLDIGFRVLKVDSSNMAELYYSPDAIGQDQLRMFVENIKPGRSSEDLLFQILLDWGVDLSLPIAREKISGNEVFFVDDNALAACFVSDGKITEDFVKLLAERQPLRVVFRDAGFKDDSVKINVEQIFKLKSPHTDIKTI